MCLNTVEKCKLPKWGIGYKIFRSNMKSITYYHDTSPIYKIGETYIDKCVKTLSTNKKDDIYRTGYHIFKDKKYLNCWIFDPRDHLIKVRYSKVVAVGKQFGDGERLLDSIVAKRMTLLEEIPNVKAK
jgi:hypothetical protein